MKDVINFTCRFPLELRNEFKLCATQEGRSMAKQLVKLAQDFVQKKKSESKNEQTA